MARTYMPNLPQFRISPRLSEFFQLKDPEADSDFFDQYSYDDDDDDNDASDSDTESLGNHHSDTEHSSLSSYSSSNLLHFLKNVSFPRPKGFTSPYFPNSEFFTKLSDNAFQHNKNEDEEDESGYTSSSEDDDMERIGRIFLFRPPKTRRHRSAKPTNKKNRTSKNSKADTSNNTSSQHFRQNSNNNNKNTSDNNNSTNDDTILSSNTVNLDDEEKWAFQRYLKSINNSWNSIRHNMESNNGGEPSGITRAVQPLICPPIDTIPVSISPNEEDSSLLSFPNLPTLASLETFFKQYKLTRSSRKNDTDNHRDGDRHTYSDAEVQLLKEEEEARRKLMKRRRRIRRRLHKQKLLQQQQQQEQEQKNNTNDETSNNEEDSLRQKIREIQSLNLPDRERDRRVQQLMTENYYRFKQTTTNTDPLDDEEEEEVFSDDEDIDDESEDEELLAQETAAYENLMKCHDALNITAEDKIPTYFNKREGTLGCQHYERGCKVECSTCKKWYTCRLCHDAAESHQLIRPDTKHMLCMHCGIAQDVAQDCAHCGETMARYYCSKCKLWDDECGKSIYHCDDCGLCRIGEGLGKDFFHCSTCNVCMSIDLQDQHRCIEHSTECNCPICGEYMFTSTETVVFMLCGHSIHQNCYHELTKTSYKCPTCSRSVVNMAAQFRVLDSEIEQQPMPEPYCNWKAIIVCNDCQAKASVAFHFLGLKCTTCGSYNTAQHKLVKPEESEHDESHSITNNTTTTTTLNEPQQTEITNDNDDDHDTPTESNTFAFPTFLDSDDNEDDDCQYFYAAEEGYFEDDDNDSEIIPHSSGFLSFNNNSHIFF